MQRKCVGLPVCHQCTPGPVSVRNNHELGIQHKQSLSGKNNWAETQEVDKPRIQLQEDVLDLSSLVILKTLVDLNFILQILQFQLNTCAYVSVSAHVCVCEGKITTVV